MAHVLFITYICILYSSVAQALNTGDLKLDGDSSTSDKVLKIYLSGQWGTISYANFSKGAADVACHQLGYSGAVNFRVSTVNSTGPVWLAGPHCAGDELHVLRCQWSQSPCDYCDHRHDVFIQCNSTQIWQNPFEGYVRLIGPSQSAGELLVYLKGQWGAVCADNFTKAEADSVCRQLGYTDSNGHQPARVIGDIWLKNLDCSGSEPCFTDCYDYPVNSSWITDCSSGTVGVSCNYNISTDWSPGTECWHQSPNNASSTAAFSTPTQTLIVSSTQPTITSTTPTSTKEQSVPVVTPTSALVSSTVAVSSSHVARSSVTSVPVVTTSVLPPSNLPVLSKGAIAGIVVGSILGLLAIVLIVCFCICFAKHWSKRRGYKQV
ncbi:hypothetical protein EMCRGX_G030784 [Ephydatia muelleri]